MRERIRQIAAALAVVAVLGAYAFYGSHGTFRFPLATSGQSYYAMLGEGFLRGQLSMDAEPPSELARLADPYDIRARGKLPVLWDASYFEGKYYLYFSAVPVVLFYVPVRVITGAYPSDELAATVFASLSFLLLTAAVSRARPRQLPLGLWILLVGVGNIVPYSLVGALFYQVAILCAATFSAAWAWSVVRYLEDRSPRWAIAMGAFLGMAIASRPNLIVLLLVQALLVWRDRRTWMRVAAPLVLIGSALMVYNYARFRSPFESGFSYQLGHVQMAQSDACGVCGDGEAMRLVNHVSHYVFWPIVFHSSFPHVWVQKHALDPTVTYPGGAEPVAGIAPVVPLTIAGAALALLFGLRGARPGPWLVLSGAVVLLALSACWWVTVRYSLDFTGLIVVGSILCIEAGLTSFQEAGGRVRPLRYACALLALYSITLGLLLPWSHGPRFMQ